MKKDEFYRVTHYDPARWVHEYVEHKAKTLKEAKEVYEKWKKEYPPQGRSVYIKIEKIDTLAFEYIDKG